MTSQRLQQVMEIRRLLDDVKERLDDLAADEQDIGDKERVTPLRQLAGKSREIRESLTNLYT